MEYTIIVKSDGDEYVAICYEMPNLQVVVSNISDAVLELVDQIEDQIAFGEELPEPLEFEEALASVGL